MSLFRLPTLPSIASKMKSIRGAFSNRTNRSASDKAFRRLLIDPLEERQLLSLSPADMSDLLVNRTVTAGIPGDDYLGSTEYTDAQQAIAVDNDGDFVVAWTRREQYLDGSNNPVIDPETGGYLQDSNIYARYFTDEVQRLTLPEQVLSDTSGGYGSFSLDYGYEVQKLTISATYEPFTYFQENVAGSFKLGYLNSAGSIEVATPLIDFDETKSLRENAMEIQEELSDIPDWANVWVEAISPREYLLHAGDAHVGDGLRQLCWVDQSNATFSSGFLPAVTIETVRDPITITDIPVSPDNPDLTAQAIEDWFANQAATSYDLAPTDFPPENRIHVIGPPPYYEPIQAQAPAPSVSVTPVAATVNPDVQVLTFDTGGAVLPVIGNFRLGFDLDGDGSIDPSETTLNDIVFNNTNASTLAGVASGIQGELEGFYPGVKVSVGSGDNPFSFDIAFKQGTVPELVEYVPAASPLAATVTSDYDRIVAGTVFDITFTGTAAKQNHSLMVVSSVKDEFGNETIIPGDHTATALKDLALVTTQKETSDEFRVNPAEVDNPFTFLPDVYDQTQPVVAIDSDGEFVIAWKGEVPNSQNSGSYSDIFSRHFAAVGSLDKFTDPTLPGGGANPDYDADFADNQGLITPGVRALASPEAQIVQVIEFNGPAAPGTFKLRIDDNTTAAISFAGTDAASLSQVAADITSALDEAGYEKVLVTVDSYSDPYAFSVNYESTFGTSLGKDQVTIEVIEAGSLGGSITVTDETEDFYTVRVNQSTANPQFDPTVAMDEEGNFVIGWANGGQELGFFNGIKAQQFDRDGVRIGSEFLVNSEDTAIHIEPYVAVSHAGNFVVAWSRTDDPDYVAGNGYVASIQAKVFDAQGNTLISQFGPGGAGEPSAAFDMANNFIITWESISDNDNIGVSSEGVQGRMYELFDVNGNVTGDVIRDTFRVNSATFNTSLNACWPLWQGGSEAALDADGDLVVTYDGFGADSSEFVAMSGSYFMDWLNLTFDPPNAPEDLFDPRFQGLWGYDIDEAIEYLLVQAYALGASDVEVGQLRAYLDQKAGLMRGEANGALFSRWDADPQLGTLDTLYSDSVLNAQRDGHNARFIIEIDSSVTGGNFTLGLSHPSVGGWEEVDITPVFVDSVLQVVETRDVIDAALEAAQRTGVNWAEDTNDGPVHVRIIGDSEVIARSSTPYALGSNPSSYIYEVTFQGEVHDTDMGLWLQDNDLTADDIAEIQNLTFTTDDTGEFYLSIGGVDSPDWSFDPGNLTGMGQLIESWLISIGYAGVTVISPPEGSSAPFDFRITFGGASAGVDQPPIAGLTPTDSTSPYPGNIYSTQIRAGAEDGAPMPFVFMHTEGDRGIWQSNVSIGMEPDGDFATVWTQYEEYTDGDWANDNIYYRRFDEATDTAGPRIGDLIDTAGNRVDADIALVSPVQYIVLTFDEAMMVGDPDVNPDSILNPENFKLFQDGIEIPGAIYHVAFGMNMASELAGKFDPLGGVYDLNPILTNKWEAVLMLDGNGSYLAGIGSLASGHYTIEAIAPVSSTNTSAGNSGLRDVVGNPLGHTGFTAGGEDFSRNFRVLSSGPWPGPGPDPGPSGDVFIADGRTYPESPNAVAVDGDGNHVVAWTGDDQRVWVQIFDADGSPADSDLNGNGVIEPGEIDLAVPLAVTEGDARFTGDQQRYASVACDEDGDFIVTWTNYRSGEVDIHARRFYANGTPMDNGSTGPLAFRVNTYTTNVQQWPDVAMNATGEFIVTWSSYSQEDGDQLGSGYGVYARRYDSFGQPLASEFLVNVTTEGNQQFSSIAMDSEGGFAVVWTSDQNGVGTDIIARSYWADGTPQPTGSGIGYLFGELLVNATTDGNQIYPDVAMNPAGTSYVVT